MKKYMLLVLTALSLSGNDTFAEDCCNAPVYCWTDRETDAPKRLDPPLYGGHKVKYEKVGFFCRPSEPFDDAAAWAKECTTVFGRQCQASHASGHLTDTCRVFGITAAESCKE